MEFTEMQDSSDIKNCDYVPYSIYTPDLTEHQRWIGMPDLMDMNSSEDMPEFTNMQRIAADIPELDKISPNTLRTTDKQGSTHTELLPPNHMYGYTCDQIEDDKQGPYTDLQASNKGSNNGVLSPVAAEKEVTERYDSDDSDVPLAQLFTIRPELSRPKLVPRCRFCKGVGHNRRLCVEALIDINNQRLNERGPIHGTCTYCKEMGHTVSNCVLKLKHKAKRLQKAKKSRETAVKSRETAGKDKMESFIIDQRFMVSNLQKKLKRSQVRLTMLIARYNKLHVSNNLKLKQLHEEELTKAKEEVESPDKSLNNNIEPMEQQRLELEDEIIRLKKQLMSEKLQHEEYIMAHEHKIRQEEDQRQSQIERQNLELQDENVRLKSQMELDKQQHVEFVISSNHTIEEQNERHQETLEKCRQLMAEADNRISLESQLESGITLLKDQLNMQQTRNWQQSAEIEILSCKVKDLEEEISSKNTELLADVGRLLSDVEYKRLGQNSGEVQDLHLHERIRALEGQVSEERAQRSTLLDLREQEIHSLIGQVKLKDDEIRRIKEEERQRAMVIQEAMLRYLRQPLTE